METNALEEAYIVVGMLRSSIANQIAQIQLLDLALPRGVALAYLFPTQVTDI